MLCVGCRCGTIPCASVECALACMHTDRPLLFAAVSTIKQGAQLLSSLRRRPSMSLARGTEVSTGLGGSNSASVLHCSCAPWHFSARLLVENHLRWFSHLYVASRHCYGAGCGCAPGLPAVQTAIRLRFVYSERTCSCPMPLIHRRKHACDFQCMQPGSRRLKALKLLFFQQ